MNCFLFLSTAYFTTKPFHFVHSVYFLVIPDINLVSMFSVGPVSRPWHHLPPADRDPGQGAGSAPREAENQTWLPSQRTSASSQGPRQWAAADTAWRQGDGGHCARPSTRLVTYTRDTLSRSTRSCFACVVYSDIQMGHMLSTFYHCQSGDRQRDIKPWDMKILQDNSVQWCENVAC